MGSGQNGQLTFIDLLSILSFAVGLQNLGINIGQDDMDRQTREIDAQAGALVSSALAEIHAHLEEQDAKINKILEAIA